MRVVPALLLICAPLAAQTTIAQWTLHDWWGIGSPTHGIRLCVASKDAGGSWSGGGLSTSTHRVITQRGEVAWQPSSEDSNCIFVEPQRRPASTPMVQYNYSTTSGGAVNLDTNPEAGYGSSFTTLPTGTLVVPSASLTNFTAGNVYCVETRIDTDTLAFSSTCGGGVLTISGSASGYITKTAGVRSGNNIVCGLLNCDEFQNGDPIRVEGSDPPGGLEACASSTCFVKVEGADTISVWSDAALTAQVTLSDAGTGPWGIISELVITLQSGTSTTATATNPVSCSDEGDYIECTNGLMGLRLLEESGQTSPPGRFALRGVLLRDGTTWVGTADNLLYRERWGNPYPVSGQTRTGAARQAINSAGEWAAADPATAFSVTQVENGPVRSCWDFAYDWAAQYDYVAGAAGTITNRGAGFVDYRFCMGANLPGYEFTGDSNMPIGDQIDLTSLGLDRFRYRQAGQDKDSDVEESADDNEALLLGAYPIANTADSTTSCMSGPTDSGGVPVCLSGAGNLTRKYVRYGMAYQNAGGDTSPVIGIIGGWTDEQFKSGAVQIPHLVRSSSNQLFGADAFVLAHLNHDLFGPDNTQLPRKKHKFFVYIGEKSEFTFGSSLGALHPINQLYNFYATVGFSQEVNWQLSKLDNPTSSCTWSTSKPCGWQFPYMPTANWNTLASRVVSDTTFYNNLRSALSLESPTFGVPILDGIRSNNEAGVDYMLREPRVAATVFLQNRARNGNMGFLGYYKWGTEGGFRRYPSLFVPLLLSSTTETQRNLAALILGTFASVGADHRYSCAGNESGNRTCGDNAGTANQALQASDSRLVGCLLIGQHTTNAEIDACVTRAGTEGQANVESAIQSNGAVLTSPGYSDTFISPAYTLLSALVNLGHLPGSTFSSRWNSLIGFKLDLMSPPDARASNSPLQITGGDSAFKKPYEIGLAPFANPGACYMWKALGSPRTAFYNTTLVTHDTECTAAEDVRVSRAYSNWGQFLRHGTTYFARQTMGAVDHAFAADQGGILQFAALGAPVLVRAPSLSDPNIADRSMLSSMVMDASWPGTREWNSDAHAIGNNTGQAICSDTEALCTSAGSVTAQEMQKFARSTRACSTYGTTPAWTTCAIVGAADSDHPWLLLTESFTGTGASDPKSRNLTYLVAASTAVTVPGGTYTPVARVHTGSSDTDRPSNGQTAPTADDRALTIGGLNSFSWSGASTVDWNSYIIPIGGSTAEYNIGHITTPEQSGGFGGATSQYVHRVHFDGTSLYTLILPYTSDYSPSVSYDAVDCALGAKVEYSSTRTCVLSGSYQYTNGTVSTLGTWNAVEASYAGITISGGPAECTLLSPTSVQCSVDSSESSTRSIALPTGIWYYDNSVSTTRTGNNTFTVDHVGGVESEPITINFVQVVPQLLNGSRVTSGSVVQ